MKQYFQGSAWEQAIGAQGRLHDLATYVKMRLFSSGVSPCFTIIDLINDSDAGAAFFQHASLPALTDIANLQSCWSNDVLGFERELGENNPSNLVRILQQDQRCSLQEAVEHAIALVNREMAAFMRLKAMLPTFDSGEDAQVRRYIAKLEHRKGYQMDLQLETTSEDGGRFYDRMTRFFAMLWMMITLPQVASISALFLTRRHVFHNGGTCMTRTLPALFSPFCRAISPHAERLQAAMDGWVDHYQLFADQYAAQQLCAGKFAWLIARAYPHATYEDMKICGQIILWTFANDDAHDAFTIPQLATVHERFLAVYHGAPQLLTDNIQCHMVADFRDQLLPGAASGWMERFGASMDSYLRATRWEVPYRERGSPPDLVDYLNIRQYSIAMPLFLDLAEMALHISLPNHIYTHPTVRRLAYLTGMIITYTNDIHSIQKEVDSDSEVMNLLLVLEHEYHLSRAQALERAIGIHDHTVAEFIGITQHLPSFGARNDALLQQYIASCELWISGHHDWYAETQRYSVRTNTLVEMNPVRPPVGCPYH